MIREFATALPGKGDKKERLEALISELKLNNKVKLLGYRSDINELLYAADIFVFPSYREGLPVALMEAMAHGMPIACSRIRGNVDLIDEGKGGVMFDPQSIDSVKDSIKVLLDADWKEMKKYNLEKIKKFGLANVMSQIKRVYEEILE